MEKQYFLSLIKFRKTYMCNEQFLNLFNKDSVQKRTLIISSKIINFIDNEKEGSSL